MPVFWCKGEEKENKGNEKKNYKLIIYYVNVKTVLHK